MKIRIETEKLPLSAALRTRDCSDTVLRWALAGGDDYELCFTLPPGVLPPSGCTQIGQVEDGAGVDCGLEIDIVQGYQHFRD